jgi:hypothetical protein
MAERAAVDRHAKPEIINSEQGGQFTCNAFLDPLRQEEVQIQHGRAVALDGQCLHQAALAHHQARGRLPSLLREPKAVAPGNRPLLPLLQ